MADHPKELLLSGLQHVGEPLDPAYMLAKELAAEIPDGRDPHRLIYPLEVIIYVSILASSAGAQNAAGIRRWWQANRSDIGRHLAWSSDIDDDTCIPSELTIRRAIAVIDKDKLAELFAGHFTMQAAKAPGKLAEFRGTRPLGSLEVLGCDGQNVRGTNRTVIGKNGKKKTKSGCDITTVYSCSTGITLAQTVAVKKNQEAAAIKKMIENMNLSGTIMTWDALNTHPDLIEAVCARGGEVIACIKSNNETAEEEISDAFSLIKSGAPCAGDLGDTMITGEFTESGHGLICKRIVRILPVSALSGEFRKKWKEVRAVYEIEAHIWIKRGGKTSEETVNIRHYVSTLEPDYSAPGYAAQVNDTVMKRWGVESGQHWVLDVIYGQDRLNAKNRDYIENITYMYKMARNAAAHVRAICAEAGAANPPSYSAVIRACGRFEDAEKIMAAFVTGDDSLLTDSDLLRGYDWLHGAVIPDPRAGKPVIIPPKEDPAAGFALAKLTKSSKSRSRKKQLAASA